MQGRAGGSCYDPDRHSIFRDRLLVGGIKHAHFAKPVFQFQETLMQRPDAGFFDLTCVKLVSAAGFVDLDFAVYFHLHAVFQRAFQALETVS